MKMDQPKKCFKIEEARALQNNWKKSRGKEIENGQGYKDTREFWYSIEELQEYLDHVKQKSKEQGVKTPGIRVYLGAYPKAEQAKSYTTIFLAPTMESSDTDDVEGGGSNKNNYDISPMNESQSGHPPVEY